MSEPTFEELRQALYRSTSLTFLERHHLRLAIDAYEAASDGVSIGPIRHEPSQCVIYIGKGTLVCKCWCVACRQHNERMAEVEHTPEWSASDLSQRIIDLEATNRPPG